MSSSCRNVPSLHFVDALQLGRQGQNQSTIVIFCRTPDMSFVLVQHGFHVVHVPQSEKDPNLGSAFRENGVDAIHHGELTINISAQHFENIAIAFTGMYYSKQLFSRIEGDLILTSPLVSPSLHVAKLTFQKVVGHRGHTRRGGRQVVSEKIDDLSS